MKYTIITGATSGIGKELAHIYARKGHHLILIARRSYLLETLKNELETDYEVSVLCYVCDLYDLETVDKTFTEINSKYEINCLINNAGISYFEKVESLTIRTIQEQANINLNSPMLATKNLITNLNRNTGSVINVCSILSYLPNFKSSVYVASKYALYGFSNSLRLEYPKLHVLTVHPITVKTNFFNDMDYFKNVKKVIEPVKVAIKIYRSHKKRRRKCNIPYSIGLLNILYQLIPGFIDSLNRRFFSTK